MDAVVIGVAVLIFISGENSIRKWALEMIGGWTAGIRSGSCIPPLLKDDIKKHKI